MDIKNLPKTGLGFKFGKGVAGNRGLGTKLAKLRRRNSQFRNLSKDNIAVIEKNLEPYKRALRIKGGLNRLQARSIGRKLFATYKQTRGEDEQTAFTKQDFRDAKKIVKSLTRPEQKEIKAQSAAPAVDAKTEAQNLAKIGARVRAQRRIDEATGRIAHGPLAYEDQSKLTAKTTTGISGIKALIQKNKDEIKNAALELDAPLSPPKRPRIPLVI